MKKLFLPILTGAMLATSTLLAQDGDGPTISLTGDTGTEQAAKLELIRILQERLNKLTVTQLNSRIIVSKGVLGYYKVEEIQKMNANIWQYRSKYVTKAGNLEKANPGFAATGGNGFAYKYMIEMTECASRAKAINDQLTILLTSGAPIVLPAMPTFSISAGSSDPGADFAASVAQIMAAHGIKSEADLNALPAAEQAKIRAEIEAANKEFVEAFKAGLAASNKQNLAIIGNIAGSIFGVPGLGSAIVGVASGNGAKALSGLVGSIIDNFKIPIDYYNSPTLKLTDAERLKMIDELHVRMSEAYQQITALAANMSTETKKRYDELSQPRNEMILYGPKK
ncbi:hypothetical protein [Spirosoma arcticum]